VMTHGTMESWDFDGSAAASPTTSVYSPRMGAFPQEGEESGDESDDDARSRANERQARRSSAEVYALRIRGRHGRPHSQSRNVSWAEDDVHNVSLNPGLSEHSHPAPIAEVDLSAVNEASSSSSDSESDLRSSAKKATLTLPAAPPLSSSPSGSSYSTSSASASTSESAAAPPSPVRPVSPAPARLWRRITAKFDVDKEKEKNTEKEKREELERSVSFNEKDGKEAPTSVGAVKRKTLAMIGRSLSGTITPAGGGGGGGGVGTRQIK